MKKQKIKEIFSILLWGALFSLATYFGYILEENFKSGGWLSLVPPTLVVGILLFLTEKRKRKALSSEEEKNDSKIPLNSTDSKHPKAEKDGKNPASSKNPESRKAFEKQGRELVGNPSFVKEKTKGKSSPDIRTCLFAALVFSIAVLFMAPLRLFSDKLLGIWKLKAVNPLLYMGNFFSTACCYVIFPAYLRELLHRKALFPKIEKIVRNPLGVCLLSGLFYTLSIPQMNNLLPHFVFGTALAYLFIEKRSFMLTSVCSLVMNMFSLLYSYMTGDFNSDGAGMTFGSIGGLALIFISVGSFLLYIVLNVGKKRKMRIGELLTVLLLTLLLFFGGMVMVSLS